MQISKMGREVIHGLWTLRRSHLDSSSQIMVLMFGLGMYAGHIGVVDTSHYLCMIEYYLQLNTYFFKLVISFQVAYMWIFCPLFSPPYVCFIAVNVHAGVKYMNSFGGLNSTVQPTELVLQEFWDWSWQELAQHDLADMITYVHSETKSKVFYVGHSQV